MDDTTVAAIINESQGPCDVDTHPYLRLAFVGFGSVISLMGCACNLLLLFVFLTRNSSNPYQTFLAFLDFMLCFLFITCFGALTLSVTFRIEWLYTLVKDNNVQMLIASRIVQLCIPYTLIANTAYRLASITERSPPVNRGRNLQITVLAIAVIAISLRLPGYFFMEVVELQDCDFFESRVLSARDVEPLVARMYTISDVFIQFLHLFVSFIILCVLNLVVIQKLRSSHERARRRSLTPTISYDTTTQSWVHSFYNYMTFVQTTASVVLQLGNELIIEGKSSVAEVEERQERKKLQCAVKTTIVIISSYLACNSVNFILYCIEMFNSSLIQTDDGYFNVFYVMASDLGTNLFVFSSMIRIFVYYKYNPTIRSEIRDVAVVRLLLS